MASTTTSSSHERKRNLLRFTYVCLIIGFIGCSLGVLGQTISDGRLFWYRTEGIQAADFCPIYSVASLARHTTGSSNKENIYDVELQNAALKKLTGLQFTGNVSVLYPPHIMVLLAALTILPIAWSWSIFHLIGISALALALYVDCKDWTATAEQTWLPFAREHAWLIMLGASVASFPGCWTLRLGQTSYLLAAGFGALFYLLRKQRWFAAGFLVPWFLLKIQYAPLPLVITLVLGRARAAFGLLSSIACIAIISAICFGPAVFQQYLHVLLTGDTEERMGTSAHAMQNFRGELMILLSSQSKTVMVASLLLGILTLAMMLLLWIRKRAAATREESTFFLLAAGTIFACLIASPHTHFPDYLIVVWAILWTIRYLDSKSDANQAGKIVIPILLCSPLVSWVLAIGGQLLLLMRIQFYFVFALAMLVWISASVLRVKDSHRAED